MSSFSEEPVASRSGRFALCRGESPIVTAEPAVRPWGLRDLVLAAPSQPLPLSVYDPVRQVSVIVDEYGKPIVGADDKPKPPTAPTTSTVDGEDPPSSEDWKNDYHPDFPWEC